MHARGGDGSDVVSTVVLHWFEMRRKKKKKKRKTYLNVLVEPSFFCKVVGCVRKGEVRCEGNKGLTFFFEGGVPSTVSGGSGSRVPARHVRAGATGWLACPKRVI